MRQAVYDELLQQADAPPANDERIAIFSRAMIRLAENEPESEMVYELFDTHPDYSPSYTVNIALRALQHQFLRNEYGYPERFITEGSWLDGVERIRHDATRLNMLRQDMQRPVQSNVVERYKGFKLALQLLHPYTGDAPRLLDVGCSRNHGLKKLKRDLQFIPPELGQANEPRWSHALLNALVSSALRQPIALGPAVGSDKQPLGGTTDASWARSCSFYPSAWLNRDAVAEYDYLDAVQFDNVEFAVGDFTQDGLLTKTRTSQFDVITSSTFLYQLSNEERAHARSLFRTLLGPRGIILYQEFAKVDDTERDIEIASNWFSTPYPYRTLVEFTEDNTNRIYEFLRWQNGRCSRWLPGNDLTDVLQH